MSKSSNGFGWTDCQVYICRASCKSTHSTKTLGTVSGVRGGVEGQVGGVEGRGGCGDDMEGGVGQGLDGKRRCSMPQADKTSTSVIVRRCLRNDFDILHSEKESFTKKTKLDISDI